VAELQQVVNNVFGLSEKNTNETNSLFNPFLNSNGEVVNPLLDYQKLLDNPNVSELVKAYISLATGLTPTSTTKESKSYGKEPSGVVLFNGQQSNNKTSTANSNVGSTGKTNTNVSGGNLGNMDIINDLPKLSESQIKAIISKHYKNSKVISPSDAKAIYNAQNTSGVSALVTLGIGGLESGWGTSNIANKTNNIWGYGATNSNPEGNAHKYSSMESAALGYSNSLKKDYYNGYGAKTINAIGTGNNPAGKGYAYNNDGSISTTWAKNVNSIMNTIYNTAISAR
jgi:beta-N-acetylglucosaminidase